jgi:hypothetical protein
MEIPRYGDFIKTIFVKMTLPPTYGVPASGNKMYIYTGSPGLHIFEYIELVIGDKVIERLDGYSMALYFMKRYGPMYNDILDNTIGGNPEQHFEYSPLNGLEFHATRYDTPDKFGGSESFNYNYVNNRNRTLFYPLPFYFFNKSSLAIPICLLHKQEVKLRFKLRDWQDLIIVDGETAFQNIETFGAGKLSSGDYVSQNYNKVNFSTIFGPLKLVDFSVPVEFAYISDDDYKYFSSRPCTYIINQTQRQLIDVASDVFNIETRIDFINPVKSIDLFVKYTNKNRNYFRNLYNVKANYARLKNGKAYMHHIESIQLDFDGEIYLSNSIANYQFLTYVQKYKYDLGFYNVTRSDRWQTTIPNILSYSPGADFYTFKKMYFANNPYNMYAKSVSGPFYSYSFALDPFSENPSGYMNFSTIRNPYININMFSDRQTVDSGLLLSEPRQVYLYAYSINILTFDPVKGNATLKFQNPTYT